MTASSGVSGGTRARSWARSRAWSIPRGRTTRSNNYTKVLARLALRSRMRRLFHDKPSAFRRRTFPTGAGCLGPETASAATRVGNSLAKPRFAVLRARANPGEIASPYVSSKDGWFLAAAKRSVMEAPGVSEHSGQ